MLVQIKSDKALAPIQGAVLDRFRDVIDLDVRFAFKIGDGAGYFQDTVVGPGGQTEFVDGVFQQIDGGLIDPAVAFNMPVDHLGVAVNLCSFKTIRLDTPGRSHTLANLFGRLGSGSSHQILVRHRRHFNVDVDTVEKRS